MALRSGTELINPFKLLERVGIRAGFHVADLGCGSLGHFIFPAAQLVGADGIVYAVDIQRAVLEQVERSAKSEHLFNIETVWSDIDVYGATRIPDASLDLTLVINNLWVSQNRPQLAKESARLTKPKGRVIVVEWKATATPMGPPPDRRLVQEEAEQVFSTPYLAFKEAFEAGAYHYGLIYERTDAPVGD
ncbi:methyltransferase domain-containing protein [Patescibacteria group bacterium]|nr:methyltransferase domain-containing protein [Patescibacteria group bacterium]MBU1448440.1 methyltransferase domain-containing protein [Patescibacteria group bacterium]MBU2612876.1 methyltransferase domain-containing protein [Patescibacteria group bacterium]